MNEILHFSTSTLQRMLSQGESGTKEKERERQSESELESESHVGRLLPVVPPPSPQMAQLDLQASPASLCGASPFGFF